LKNECPTSTLKNKKQGIEIIADGLWGRFTLDGKIISFGTRKH